MFRLVKRVSSNSMGSKVHRVMYKSKSSVAASTAVDVESPDYLKRLKITAEVTVSKIFPAGFGWQYGACSASAMGCQGTDLSFAVLTGLGDMTGVVLGHTIYYMLKRSIDPSIDIKKEFHTSIFLGSAAFFSGFIWQPAVNILEAAGTLPVGGVMLGAWGAGSLCFMFGLRLGRAIYSPFLNVAKANDKNFKQDALLSTSIGGAAAGFVGTDTLYLDGAGNPLKSLVGIYSTDSNALQMVKAGLSTSVGFLTVQTSQNISNSKGDNWTD